VQGLPLRIEVEVDEDRGHCHGHASYLPEKRMRTPPGDKVYTSRCFVVGKSDLPLKYPDISHVVGECEEQVRTTRILPASLNLSQKI
jgi:hypothetical protein